MNSTGDTICAVATPAGRGGISVIRVSGPACQRLCEAVFGKLPAPNKASLGRFHDGQGELIDQGAPGDVHQGGRRGQQRELGPPSCSRWWACPTLLIG